MSNEISDLTNSIISGVITYRTLGCNSIEKNIYNNLEKIRRKILKIEIFMVP